MAEMHRYIERRHTAAASMHADSPRGLMDRAVRSARPPFMTAVGDCDVVAPQASAMFAEPFGCGVDDALALLRVRDVTKDRFLIRARGRGRAPKIEVELNERRRPRVRDAR